MNIKLKELIINNVNKKTLLFSFKFPYKDIKHQTWVFSFLALDI